MDREHALFPRYLGMLAALLGIAWLFLGLAWGAVGEPSGIQIQKAYGDLPLHFIANQGQSDEWVKYYTQGGGYAFFFTRDGVMASLKNPGKSAIAKPEKGRLSTRVQPPSRGEIVKLNLVGMNPDVQLAAGNLQTGKVNYFVGNDPGKWVTRVATYGSVVYREAYPGIDVKFYGNGRQLEYDLIVRPGADPAQARFQYQGIQGLTATREGGLLIQLSDGGSLLQKKPVIYQEIGGERIAREGKFKILEDAARFTYGFEIAAYDSKYPLVIDPTLDYSSYLGGSDYDYGYGIAVDGAGSAYVTGTTFSSDFPVAPTGTNTNITQTGIISAIFVSKINYDSVGTPVLAYTAVVGGGGYNYGNAIAVDDAGCAYVAGEADAADFPMAAAVNPLYPYGGQGDAIVFKLNASGDSLVYSTFLGGSSLDSARGIAVKGNAVYVTGQTYSSDFPVTSNAYQTHNGGGGDGFVAKITFVGTALSLGYCTYLGGSGYDECNGIAVDGLANAYVVGETVSKNFPVTAKPGSSGSDNAFVAKFSSGGQLQYSVRLGGSKANAGQAIAVDMDGNAYITGYTNSGTGFPRTNALTAQTAGAKGEIKTTAANKGSGSQINYDAFVTKINPSGKSLVYSVLLGGSGDDFGYGIAVDSLGCAYVTGRTSSSDFPLQNPLSGEGKGAGWDVFVTKLNPAGNGLLFSTYLSGNADDVALAIAVDAAGSAYVTGYTNSTNFSKNAFQPNLQNPENLNPAYYDAFVAKISQIPSP